MRMAWPIMAVCGLALAVLAGCNDPNQMQIESLQKQVGDLQRENDDLRSRLAKAIQDRDAALARARALQQQLDAAQQPVEKGPPGWEVSGPYAWIGVGTDFLFDSGKATLKAEGRAKLQEIVNTIHTTPGFSDKAVWVLGHTDTDPIKVSKWTDNLQLSCERSMTVYRELMKMGLRPERMVAGGQGEWFPKAKNDTRAGKSQNRRVEIILVPPREPIGTPMSGEPAPAPRTTTPKAATPRAATPTPTPAAPAGGGAGE